MAVPGVSSEELQFIIRMRDEASETLRRVAASTREAGDSGKAAKIGFGEFTEAVGKASGAIYIFLENMRFVRGSVDDFMKIERGMGFVSRAANTTAEETRKLKTEFERMAAGTPVTVEQLMKIAQTAAQLGVRGVDNIVNFTDVMQKLQVVTGGQGEQFTQGLVHLINLTGMTGKDVDALASTLNRLSSEFGASEEALLDSAEMVARVGATFRVSAGEAMAFGAVLASLGVNPRQGATAVAEALRSINEALSAADYRMTVLSKVTGMTGEDMRKTFNEQPVLVLRRFLSGLHSASEDTGTLQRVLKNLGLDSVDTYRALLTLANNSDKVSAALRTQRSEMVEATALNKQFNEAMTEGKNKAEAMGNVWASFTAMFGESLARTFEGSGNILKGFLADVREGFEFIGPAAQGWVATVTAGGVAVTSLFVALKALAPLLPIITGGLAAMSATLLTLGAFLLTNPLGLLITAIGLAAIGVAVFADKSDHATVVQRRYNEALEHHNKLRTEANALTGEAKERAEADARAVLKEAEALLVYNIESNRRLLAAQNERTAEALRSYSPELRRQATGYLEGRSAAEARAAMIADKNLSSTQKVAVGRVLTTLESRDIAGDRVREQLMMEQKLAEMRGGNLSPMRVPPSTPAGAQGVGLDAIYGSPTPPQSLGDALKGGKLGAGDVAQNEQLRESVERAWAAKKKAMGEEVAMIGQLKVVQEEMRVATEVNTQAAEQELTKKAGISEGAIKKEIAQRQDLARARMAADAVFQNDETIRKLRQETGAIGLTEQQQQRYNLVMEATHNLRQAGVRDIEGNLAALNKEIDRLQAAQNAQKGYAAGWNNFWRDFQLQAEDHAAQVRTVLETTMSGLTDLFSDFFTGNIQGWRAHTAQVLQQIAKIAMAELVIKPALQAASTALGMASWFGGGASASMAGGQSAAMGGMYWEKGGVSSGRVKRLAQGGLIDKPTIFFADKGLAVGAEHGQTEAVMPLTRDSAGNLAVHASGAGGGNVNNFKADITINTGPNSSVDERFAAQVSSQLKDMFESMMADFLRKNTRTGGLLAQKSF